MSRLEGVTVLESSCDFRESGRGGCGHGLGDGHERIESNEEFPGAGDEIDSGIDFRHRHGVFPVLLKRTAGSYPSSGDGSGQNYDDRCVLNSLTIAHAIQELSTNATDRGPPG